VLLVVGDRERHRALVSTSRSGRFLALVAIAKLADEIVADRRSGSGNHQQIAALDQRFGRGRLDVQAGTVDEDLDHLVMQGGTLRETFSGRGQPSVLGLRLPRYRRGGRSSATATVSGRRVAVTSSASVSTAMSV